MKSFFEMNEEGATKLFESGAMDRPAEMQGETHKLMVFLFSKGLNPNQLLRKNEPLLHFVVRHLPEEIILLFKNNGASLDLRS